MELQIARRLLGRWLDVQPRALIGAADAGGEDWPCDVWVYRPGTGAGPGCVYPAGSPPGADEPLTALLQPPAAVCVLVARSQRGEAELEEMRRWWEASGPTPAPSLLRAEGEDWGLPALEALLCGTRMELERSSAEQGSLSGQLDELRFEAELMQSSCERLQDDLARRCSAPELVLSLPPERTWTPAAGGTLRQPLPVAAEGLAAVALHFPADPETNQAADLTVSLHALDLGEDLAVWQLAPEVLGKGWVCCLLPQTLIQTTPHLEIRVRWSGAGRAISLADAGAWTELLARTDEGRELEGPLALLAWSMVPGFPLAAGQPGRRGFSNTTVEFTLARAELTRLRSVLPPGTEPPGWASCHLLEGSDFRLHPLGAVANTALLERGCPPGVDRVSAVLRISGGQARYPVQFALLVAGGEPAGDQLVQPSPTADPRTLAFSGWHEVDADGQARLLHVDLQVPAARPGHLVFGTRIAPGDGLDFAWAEWSDVCLRLGCVVVSAVTPEAFAGPPILPLPPWRDWAGQGLWSEREAA